jgi:protein-disulfide isomerase
MPVRFVAAVAVAVAVACTAAACTSSVPGQAVAAPDALAQSSGTDPALAVIPVRTVPGSDAIPVTIDRAGATVLAGKPGAKVQIDLYEDYLCPICGRFDAEFSSGIYTQLAAGTVQIRYHPLNLLDAESDPPGYSMLAANAALAVATATPGKFLAFQASLFGHQPPENGRGWTQGELKNLAIRLGAANGQFDSLVVGQTYDRQIQANLTSASKDPALQQDAGGSSAFGTPTLLAAGRQINWVADANWLNDLVSAAH